MAALTAAMAASAKVSDTLLGTIRLLGMMN